MSLGLRDGASVCVVLNKKQVDPPWTALRCPPPKPFRLKASESPLCVRSYLRGRSSDTHGFALTSLRTDGFCSLLFPLCTCRQGRFLHHHVRQPPGGALLVPGGFFLQAVQVAVVAVAAHQGHHPLQQAVQQEALPLQPPDGGQVVVPLHLELGLQVTDLQFGCFQLSQRVGVVFFTVEWLSVSFQHNTKSLRDSAKLISHEPPTFSGNLELFGALTKHIVACGVLTLKQVVEHRYKPDCLSSSRGDPPCPGP